MLVYYKLFVPPSEAYRPTWYARARSTRLIQLRTTSSVGRGPLEDFCASLELALTDYATDSTVAPKVLDVIDSKRRYKRKKTDTVPVFSEYLANVLLRIKETREKKVVPVQFSFNNLQ